MKIYLDDERQTPNGFVRTYTVEETIELIKQNNGNVETVSLDNDLGIGLQEGRKVLEWIEEQAYHNQLLPIPNIIIHTGNNVAMDNMMKSRYNAWKYWEKQGHSRIEWFQKDYI